MVSKKPKNNVIRFPVEGLRKFGFEKAKKRSESAMEREGQLSLFDQRPAEPGEVLSLPTSIGAFDEALLLDERGDERAEATYRKAIEEGDYVADAYCNLGIFECGRENTTAALECFAQSLANEPRHFEAHYNMGNLYFELGDLTLARVHYEQAVSIEPEAANVYFNLGLVHAMAEHFEAAVDALTTYRELAPRSDTRMADELLLMLRQSLHRKPSH
jgi:tetratricopeptide (TPR) repeat protein